MFEKWATRCPNSAEFRANSAEFRGRGVLHVRKSKKRGIFRGKLSKKGTFWEVFQPEFRGIPRNSAEISETTEIDKIWNFGPQADRDQEIAAFALVSRGGRPVSFVRVSSHVISPSKSQVSARMARISGKNAKLWSIQVESAQWHYFSAFPCIRSEKHS